MVLKIIISFICCILIMIALLIDNNATFYMLIFATIILFALFLNSDINMEFEKSDVLYKKVI